MKRIVSSIVGVACTFLLSAQTGQNPTPDDINQAQQLKSQFEDEDIVVLSKTMLVRFKKGVANKVSVIQTETTDYMNISSSYRTQHAVVYDAESRVTKFHVKNRKGRIISALSSNNAQDEYLSSNDLFHTDYRVKYANLTFPLQGHKYRLETQLLYNDSKYFASEYLSSGYRILEGTYTIDIPIWLDLELKEFNFEGYDITKEIKDAPGGKQIVYTLKDAPPNFDDPQTPGPSHLYPHILFIAKSYTQGNVEKELFKSTDNLFGWYNSLIEQVDINPNVFKDKVGELTTNTSSDIDKIKNIYYWVQDNIRYVAFEDGIAGFKPDSPQNVFTKRFGDCKGMAILIQTMLKEAGFDSRLVWIGTDRLAYDYSIPSLSVDNHMICAVKLDGDYIFLDGTEKFNRFGEYASRIQHKQALVRNGNVYEIITIPDSQQENSDFTHYNFEIVDNNLIGIVNRAFDGESRVDFQNAYSSFGKERQEEILINYLTSGNDNYTIPYIEPFDAENRETKIILSYDAQIKNAIADFDNTLYIDLDPKKNADRLILDDRKAPLLLYSKEIIKTTIDLKIPDNYKVRSLPENFEFLNDHLAINVNYEQTASHVKFSKSIRFRKRRINPEDFAAWDEAFKRLKEVNEEQIILIQQ